MFLRYRLLVTRLLAFHILLYHSPPRVQFPFSDPIL